MTKARTLADNYAADINQVSAGVGITGGGTSGTVTITNDMATTIAAKGDLVVGTGNDTYTALSTGTTGQVLTVDSTTASGLKWGTISSGYTWTARQYPTTKGINAIAYNGSNLYVAVADSGGLYTSPDGITWTSRTSGFGTQNIYGIAYGASTWVAVGGNGLIFSSTDGTTWTSRTANVSTNALYAVTFANSLFVAVGNGASGGTGGITTSSNGTTWTKQTTPATSSTELYSIAYGNGEWVAVGNNLTRQGYYSTDGVTWTVLPNLSSTNYYYVTYTNSSWFAVGATNTARAATTASGTWSARSNFSLPNISLSSNTYQGTIQVYNNKFYTITPQRLGIQSTTFSGTNMLEDGTNYTLPSYYDGNSYTTTNYRAIYVDGTGIVVGTDQGKIYTSF